MLFHSSLRRELARSFVATLVVLVTVVMSMMLIRTLGLASSGRVDPKDVMLLLGYSVLGHLSTILTLSLFICVTSTLGRMYRDSEMAIWFSSGRGLASFFVPVMKFAWPILLAIFLLALFAWPWSNQQTQRMRQTYESRGELDRVAAGQFQENAAGTRVFFIERDDALTATPSAQESTPQSLAASITQDGATTTVAALANKTARNVFVLSTQANQQAVTSARTGKIERINNEQFLVLRNGQHMQQTAGQTALKISEFEEYSVRIGQKAASAAAAISPKILRTNQLLSQPTAVNLGELSWRFGLGLAAFNLVFLALVLSATNPRAGRGYSLIFALLAFVVYYNMLNIAFSWIGNGRYSFTGLMLTLHGGVFVATCVLLAVRHTNWSLKYLLAPKPTLAPP